MWKPLLWMLLSENLGAEGTIPKINKDILKGNLPWRRKTAREIKFCVPRIIKINTQTALNVFSRHAYHNNHVEGSRERRRAKPQRRTTPSHQLSQRSPPPPNGKPWRGDWKQPGRGEPDVTEKWTHLKNNPNENKRSSSAVSAQPDNVVGRWLPHHPLQGAGHPRGLVQQLAVLQLLAQPLQRVQRLVEFHRHGHLRQVLPYVISQDVPQADVAAVVTWCWQTSSSFGLCFPAAFENRP